MQDGVVGITGLFFMAYPVAAIRSTLRVNFKIIHRHVLQAFLNDFCTAVQHVTRFQLTLCCAVSEIAELVLLLLTRLVTHCVA